jgi:hypothetical protein
MLSKRSERERDVRSALIAQLIVGVDCGPYLEVWMTKG